MQIDLETLRRRVADVIKQSSVAGQVGEIAVEPDQDEEGTDFLRVTLQVRNPDQYNEEDFEFLLERIEKTVGDIDEQYPSVRFSDAA